MDKQIITTEQIKSLLDNKYNLYYTDYRENLDEQLDIVQKCIHNNNKDILYENINEWYIDTNDSIEYILKELKEKISKTFYISSSEVNILIDKNRDNITDEILNRDDSDILKDLLHNTSKQTFFYELGVEIGDDTTPIKERLHDVKKALKLKLKDKTFDDKIIELCNNASYGGSLVLYFYDNIDDYLERKGNENIIFKNLHVAIIDTYNGSGYNIYLRDVIYTTIYNSVNLYLCKNIKNSYTFEVCGMYSDWCKNTIVNFSKRKKMPVKEIVKTKLQRDIEIDNMYKLKWNNGNGTCTSGDMDTKRHKNTSYINEFPCGMRCSTCGTFWID